MKDISSEDVNRFVFHSQDEGHFKGSDKRFCLSFPIRVAPSLLFIKFINRYLDQNHANIVK